MKRVTFICGGRLVPASRFRVEPIASALAGTGWRTHVIYGYGTKDAKLHFRLAKFVYRAGCRLLRAVRTAALDPGQAVVVQRLALPWSSLPESILAFRGVRLIFDFDDAVFLGKNGAPSVLRRRALESVFRRSSHVVAGNSWLASLVPTNVPVSVVPTCIDTTLYSPDYQTRRAEVPRLGWMGTSGNLPYLRQLASSLAKLRDKGVLFDLVICSDAFDAKLCDELGASFVKWEPEIEIDTLRSFDVGLMPLEDTDWCRGKCSFKAIQYMSVGVPVIASDVGFNRDVIRNGIDGFLVTEEGWEESLTQLLVDEEVRTVMGANARQRAVDDFDISVAISAYQSILDSL